MSEDSRTGRDDHILGMDQKITRQDFLNSVLLASGAFLLDKSPAEVLSRDDWTGYGGIGDYAGSNGNTFEVMTNGHTIRDRAFERSPQTVHDTGEIFDCAIVGGGISGLAAALFFQRNAKSAAQRRHTCLVLDDHPVFGGEAKRNEFEVDGQKLIAHQGSAMFFPPLPDTFLADFYPSIGIDWHQLRYQTWHGSERELPLANTPYLDDAARIGFFFGAKFGHPEGLWVIDPWAKELQGAPISAQARSELLRMHTPSGHSSFVPPQQNGDAISRHLDSITLEQHICNLYGVSVETVRTFLSPVAGGGSGIGPDVLSAYSDYAADVLFPWEYSEGAQMFPGGNTAIARHMLKTVIPDSIPGPVTLANICQMPIRFGALDRPTQSTRIRMPVTVISVEHDSAPEHSSVVSIVYLKSGSLYRVKAQTAIMAGGSWTTKHIVRDLPASHRQAYAEFYRSPCLMANVAVRNWRFLYKLGITGCQWFDGIGNYLAVRKSATCGGTSPIINPDSPVVLTLKILFSKPGLPIQAQTIQGRAELLATSFREYERRIREQFTQMFGPVGFDARRDMAAIILNRWGHAYLSPQPGFFFGKDGKPAPGNVLRNAPSGRITFANSDLTGIMDHRASIMEGKRAAEQVLAML